jgi:hypothetical protein
MFSGCTSLTTIFHDGEILLSDGELDLFWIHASDSSVHDLFTGVQIHIVNINANSSFSQAFIREMETVQTVFYHSFLESSFVIPPIIKYFPNVKDISIGPYDIMRDSVIDLSHTTISDTGLDAFKGIKVTSVELPITLKSLFIGIFRDCSELESVVIPYNISGFSRYCFYGCSKLSSLIVAGVNLFEGSALDFAGSTITALEFMSFYEVSTITKIIFEGNLTYSFGDYCFARNPNLQEVEFLGLPLFAFDPINPFYETDLVRIIIPKGTFCYDLPTFNFPLWGNTPLSSYTDWSMTNCISEFDISPVSIPGYVFRQNDTTRLISLTVSTSSAEIPNRVKYILIQSFSNSFVTDVTFQTNSNLTTIDEYGFRDSKIVNIVFPSGYSILNQRLLSDVSTLVSVQFLGNVTKIPALGFYQCNKHKTVKISSTTIQSEGNLNLDSIQDVGREAFFGVSFNQITIPSSISDYGSIGLFYNSNLSTAIFQNPISSFPAYIFAGCTNLTSIVVNNTQVLQNGELHLENLGLFKLGFYAFYQTPIQSLIFTSQTTFPPEAFEEFPNLFSTEFVGQFPNPLQFHLKSEEFFTEKRNTG